MLMHNAFKIARLSNKNAQIANSFTLTFRSTDQFNAAPIPTVTEVSHDA